MLILESTSTFSHYLLTLVSFQTCVTCYLLWNIKEDILKKVGNQIVPVLIDLHCIAKKTTEGNRNQNCLVINTDKKKCVLHKNDMHTDLK